MKFYFLFGVLMLVAIGVAIIWYGSRNEEDGLIDPLEPTVLAPDESVPTRTPNDNLDLSTAVPEGVWQGGIPEVMEVLYREDPVEGLGYFFVVFDKPINPSGDMIMRVDRYGFGEEDLPLVTDRTANDQLKFGPIRIGRYVALRILKAPDAEIVDDNGRPAVLGFYPAVAMVFGPENAIRVLDRRLASCLFTLQAQPGIDVPEEVIDDVRRGRVDTLEDADMIRWAKIIRENTGHPQLDPLDIRHAGACRELWSQPSDQSNDLKRNWQFHYNCIHTAHGRGFRPEAESNELASFMGRPFSLLTVEQKMLLRYEVGTPACKRFYPQLFYDRWIPVENDLYYRWGSEDG